MPCLCSKNDNRPSPVSEIWAVILGMAKPHIHKQRSETPKRQAQARNGPIARSHLAGHKNERGAGDAHKSGAKPLSTPGKIVTSVTSVSTSPRLSAEKS
jgi:hypothetical protein